jgi:hypothetical protein
MLILEVITHKFVSQPKSIFSHIIFIMPTWRLRILVKNGKEKIMSRFYINTQTIPWEQISQPKVEVIVFRCLFIKWKIHGWRTFYTKYLMEYIYIMLGCKDNCIIKRTIKI